MSKWMWIIAGPNGAGKSSFAGDFLVNLGQRNLKKLNADELTVDLRKENPTAVQDDLNLAAAKTIDAMVFASIEAGESFVVETVLSSPKYQKAVVDAKAKGIKFGLVYVSLYPPELSPQRVAARVKKGGHDVPYEKTIKRHRDSHLQLSWFAPRADTLFVFDNSLDSNTPTLVALRGDGKPLKYLAPGLNPSVDNALAAMVQKNKKLKFEP